MRRLVLLSLLLLGPAVARSQGVEADTDGGGTSDVQEVRDGTDPADPRDDFDADPDADGLSTRDERRIGTNPIDPDTDVDGLSDGLEANNATSPLRADTDADGLLDGDEDADRDGMRDPGETDPTRRDTDGGGTPDGRERTDGTDPLAARDDLDADPDGDGFTSRVERMHGLDPFDADSDDDGVPDGDDPGALLDGDGDGLVGALDPDGDDDGLPDGLELGVSQPGPDTDRGAGRFRADADPFTRTDPTRADTDGGGTHDGAEDVDANGAVDLGETDPRDGSDDGRPTDTDGDGLTDLVEMALGLDPRDADSDDDGLSDGAEPNYNVDHDLDGRVNALDPDSDQDGLPDGLESGITRAGPGTDAAAGHFFPDADPATRTSPLLSDTDHGGLSDGVEDRDRNGRLDPGELDPTDPTDDLAPDLDGDGLPDAVEEWAGTRRDDRDSDDDGLEDGADGIGDADGDGVVDALDIDADDDGLGDGTEAGVGSAPRDTDPARGAFVPDRDPATRTDHRNPDTDGDGARDGDEDANRNGRVDHGETDPNRAEAEPDAAPPPDAAVDAAQEADAAPPPDAALDAAPIDGDATPDVGAAPRIHARGGAGCAATPGSGAPLLLLILLALAWRRRRAPVVALFAALLPIRANAFDVNRFRTAIGAGGLLATESAQVAAPPGPRFGLTLHYARAPFVAEDETETRLGEPVQALSMAELTAAFAPLERLELGVGLPIVFTLDGEAVQGLSDETRLRGVGLGDARLFVKGALLPRPERGVGVAFAMAATAPFGDEDRWLGDAGPTFEPMILVEGARRPFRLLANLGYRIRPEERIADVELDDEIAARVGFDYLTPFGMHVLAEIDGATRAEAPLGDAGATRFEFLGGLRWGGLQCFGFTAGAGAGIGSGIGAPTWRAIGGLIYECEAGATPVVVEAPERVAKAVDADGDGIVEGDACPDVAEDRDGREDDDGCPEADPPVDTDGDGLADRADRCPGEAEDRDGFADADGCPDPDNDADGFADAVDKCPDQAETPGDAGPEDGCPDPKIRRLRSGAAAVEGRMVRLDEKVRFDADSARMMPSARALLADVARLMIDHPELGIVRIEAHTDSRGDDERNLRLSWQQAEAVRDYLVDLGVPSARLEVRGMGESAPIESNASDAGREANRRVELHVVGPAGG